MPRDENSKEKTCLYSHTNRFLKPHKRSLASESCRRWTRTTDLTFLRIKANILCGFSSTSKCALPTELHGIPYIFTPHTSSWQPHQPTPYDAEPIRTIGLAIRIPYFNSFCMLRCHRNHSAFNSHNLPSDYGSYGSRYYLPALLLSSGPNS